MLPLVTTRYKSNINRKTYKNRMIAQFLFWFPNVFSEAVPDLEWRGWFYFKLCCKGSRGGRNGTLSISLSFSPTRRYSQLCASPLLDGGDDDLVRFWWDIQMDRLLRWWAEAKRDTQVQVLSNSLKLVVILNELQERLPKKELNWNVCVYFQRTKNKKI